MASRSARTVLERPNTAQTVSGMRTSAVNRRCLSTLELLHLLAGQTETPLAFGKPGESV